MCKSIIGSNIGENLQEKNTQIKIEHMVMEIKLQMEYEFKYKYINAQMQQLK